MIDKKFVFIKNDFNLIKKNEVGILQEETSNGNYRIFFVVSGEEVELKIDDFEFFDINKTGDNFPKKVCNVCHRYLDTNNFSKNQNGKNNRTVRRPSCDECRKFIDGVNVSASDRRLWEKNKPEYEPFKCPICSKTTIPGLTSKIVLDHDHDTGEVRGWICDSCNTGLGRFKDSVDLLKKAIDYLETKKK